MVSLNFGDYKGDDIQDVPISYLRWCEKNLTNARCKDVISDEITRRTGKSKAVRMADDPKVSPTNGKPYPKCLYNKTLRKDYEAALKRGLKFVRAGKSVTYQIFLQDRCKIVTYDYGYESWRDFCNVELQILWEWEK